MTSLSRMCVCCVCVHNVPSRSSPTQGFWTLVHDWAPGRPPEGRHPVPSQHAAWSPPSGPIGELLPWQQEPPPPLGPLPHLTPRAGKAGEGKHSDLTGNTVTSQETQRPHRKHSDLTGNTVTSQETQWPHRKHSDITGNTSDLTGNTATSQETQWHHRKHSDLTGNTVTSQETQWHHRKHSDITGNTVTSQETQQPHRKHSNLTGNTATSQETQRPHRKHSDITGNTVTSQEVSLHRSISQSDRKWIKREGLRMCLAHLFPHSLCHEHYLTV